MFEFTWSADPIAFSIFGMPIRYYGIIFLAVFLGGYALFRLQVLRGGGSEEDASDIFVPAILGVILGARFGHVVFYEFDKALQNPLWIFQIWKGGLASHGATLGLLVAIWYYAWRHKQKWLEVLDRFAMSCGLGAALVRLGNFINSEIVGRATDGTWGVRFPRYEAEPILRHPSQLYEFALGLFCIFAVWLMDRILGREERPRGALIATFFAVYFTGRFLVEFVKEYQTLGADFPLTMGQVLSIPAALVGVIGLVWSIRRGEKAGWHLEPAAADSRASRRRGAKKGGKGKKKRR